MRRTEPGFAGGSNQGMAEPGSGSCSTVFGVVAVAHVSRAAAGDGGTPRRTVSGVSVSHGNSLTSCRSPQPALPGIRAPAGATGASARAPQERRPAVTACRASAKDGLQLSRIRLSFRSGVTPSQPRIRHLALGSRKQSPGARRSSSATASALMTAAARRALELRGSR